MAPPPSVLITGASGLLGRAILAAFTRAGWAATGAAFSRAIPPLIPLDVRLPAACAEALRSLAPRLVVHAAAERRPDACEKDPAAAELLNVDAVWHLAREAARSGAAFIYISTDYLWDGTAAPYAEDAPVCPLNAYGAQKARGEWAARAAHPGACVLRVPVLFGPTSDLGESAVTMFAAAVKAQEKPGVADDWQIRVPTFTPDIVRPPALRCRHHHPFTHSPQKHNRRVPLFRLAQRCLARPPRARAARR